MLRSARSAWISLRGPGDSPHCLRGGDERIAAGAALGGVTHGVAKLRRGQHGDPVSEVGQAVDVLVVGEAVDHLDRHRPVHLAEGSRPPLWWR